MCVHNQNGEIATLLACSSACAPSLKSNLIDVFMCMVLCLSGTLSSYDRMCGQLDRDFW